MFMNAGFADLGILAITINNVWMGGFKEVMGGNTR
jgi:hypothetical protein